MQLIDITKTYDDRKIFDNFNFTCSAQDFVLVYGESGVGKTTLLNIIAGLCDYSGRVELDGTMSYMFQDDILLDSLNVLDNLILTTKLSVEEINAIAKKFNIQKYLHLFPKELSGGIARRVSLIRALYFGSDTILLDEPTKSLDSDNANVIANNIIDFYVENKKNIILVTHNENEFSSIATKVIRLNNCE